MANFITICRIIFSILLLFLPVFSIPFYLLYLLAGITDMIDGTVARVTNTVSKLGSKLDTVADLIFLTVCFFKILPHVELPVFVYIWIGCIAIGKVFNLISGMIICRKLVESHTILNKITGFLLFLFPLTFSFLDIRISSLILCAIATIAAVHEGYTIQVSGA